MDIEKILQSNENKKEDREQATNPVDDAIDKINSLENKAEDLIISGRKKIEKVEKDFGMLPQDIIDSVMKEIDLEEKQEDIGAEIEGTVEDFSNFLAEYFPEYGEYPEKKEKEDSIIIEKGEEFHPQKELGKILKAPKSERRKLLREYKEKLAFQKEGLAKMQEEIIGEIVANSDAPLSELYEWVISYGYEYGLTSEQKSQARGLLSAYEKKHLAVKNFLRKHEKNGIRDDGVIFSEVFGQKPKGRIEIIEGPMTLYFRCEDLADYALIHSQSFMGRVEPTDEQKEEAKKSGGVSIGSSLMPELRGTIIAENSGTHFDDFYNSQIMMHEEQHAIKQLFGTRFQRINGWQRLSMAENEEERLLALRNYLRLNRESEADERARDEILAYFIGQGYSVEKVVEILTKPKEEGGLYDYLINEKSNTMRTLVNKFGQEFESTAQEEIDHIFVEEYQQLIEKSARALETLSKNGYTSQQVVAILIQEPLERWDKVVKRLIAEKDSRVY